MKQSQPYLHRSWNGFNPYFALVALVTGLLHLLFVLSPTTTEVMYGHGIFPLVRDLLSILFAWIPWPLIGLSFSLLLAILLYLAYAVMRDILGKESGLRQSLYSLVYFLIALYAMFYLLWGFNYLRPNAMERMQVVQQPDVTWLLSEITEVQDQLNAIRKEVTIPTYAAFDVSGTKASLTSAIRQVIKSFGYKSNTQVPLRLLKPNGVLLHWSTSGMYWPFTGEANIDHGLHPLDWPVTIAHELAHAYGVAYEGDCNLYAFLACQAAQDPFIRYSGLVDYYLYLLKDAQRNTKLMPSITKLKQGIDVLVKEDINRMLRWNAQYKDYAPVIRKKIYDGYLKSQGVKAGIQSYNEVVQLKYAYEHSKIKSAEIED